MRRALLLPGAVAGAGLLGALLLLARSGPVPGGVPATHPRGGQEVDHSDPLRLVAGYHRAVEAGDLEAIADCYIPERRRSVSGMLATVPRRLDWRKLTYAPDGAMGDVRWVRVRGRGVAVESRRLEVDERVKVRRVRGRWYLDDL